jgi:hypothetical protein
MCKTSRFGQGDYHQVNLDLNILYVLHNEHVSESDMQEVTQENI